MKSTSTDTPAATNDSKEKTTSVGKNPHNFHSSAEAEAEVSKLGMTIKVKGKGEVKKVEKTSCRIL